MNTYVEGLSVNRRQILTSKDGPRTERVNRRQILTSKHGRPRTEKVKGTGPG